MAHLTDADRAQLAEGIEEFIVCGDPAVRDVWQPYLDKLQAPVRTVGALELVLYLTTRQGDVQHLRDEYPQGGYQRELDIIEGLLQLVEGTECRWELDGKAMGPFAKPECQSGWVPDIPRKFCPFCGRRRA
jgi:hypothetical protein